VSWDKIIAAFEAPATPEFEGKEQVQDHKHGTRAIGMAAVDEKGHLEPHVFTRRTPGPDDIHIQVRLSSFVSSRVAVCSSVSYAAASSASCAAASMCMLATRTVDFPAHGTW